MENQEREYFIYRHVRLDTNEVFYIGYGMKTLNYNCFYNEFKRAFCKHGRNKHWNSITKNNKFKVEILFESNSEKQILEKEKEFIKLYGRRDCKLGNLVNYTDGGEIGSKGYKWTDEQKKRMSDIQKGRDCFWNIGRKRTDEEKRHLSNLHKGKIVSQETRDKLSKSNRGKRTSIQYNFIILLDNNNNLISKFNSILEASEFYKVCKQSIYNSLSGKTKINRLGVWKLI